MDIEGVKSLARQLDLLVKESGIGMSISCYGDRAIIFLHDDGNIPTESLEDMEISHVSASKKQ